MTRVFDSPAALCKNARVDEWRAAPQDGDQPGENVQTNRLYFGDCLEVMQEYIPDESVDLIYLDPPFNSKRIYNAYIGGAQWVAFDDTWHWHEAVDDFHAVASASGDLARTMEGFRMMLGEGADLAYLSYMANRLRECWRVLTQTGSLYLHCDPTMSHKLKLVLDALFGRKNFRNEIVWCYTGPGSPHMRQFNRKHDAIFWFNKGKTWKFNRDAVRIPYKSGKPHTGGFVHKSGDKVGTNMTKEVAESYTGKIPEDWWPHRIAARSKTERTGYPTQKPLAVLERIIRASSNPGDVVFDPFCGCGTTIHAAQNLGRRWIGIDICAQACKVIQKRIEGHFDNLWDDIEFVGMPKTIDDARTLAEYDPFKFEKWAASLTPGMEANKRQRGDGGIDGRGRYPLRKGVFVDVVSQVKGGKTQPAHVQAFNEARRQAQADMGVFTCFEGRVTHGMRDAAVNAGRFQQWPVLQIYTVEDYFAERTPNLPIAVQGA